MPALADRGDFADRPRRPRHQTVDQGRLADPGVAHQHRQVTGERLLQLAQVLVRAAQHVGEKEFGVVVQDLFGPGQVRLGQAQQRLDLRVIGGHQTAIDKSGTRRRVRQRADDHQLVGVGDDDAFQSSFGGGVVVIGGTPEHRRALVDAYDPGQRPLAAGHIADQGHPITYDDTAPAQLAGTHGGEGGATDVDGVAATVDGHHEAFIRVLMPGPDPGARPGRLAGTDPDVVLVVFALSTRQKPLLAGRIATPVNVTRRPLFIVGFSSPPTAPHCRLLVTRRRHFIVGSSSPADAFHCRLLVTPDHAPP